MELKWQQEPPPMRRAPPVLIAPLWNWNPGDGFLRLKLTCSNRTFMELKWQKTWRRRVRHSVLIAPLWNWNGDLVYIHGSLRIVLIAPLWNWNFQAKEIRRSLELVLIAPLWNWNYIETVIPDKADNRSNRTFMELK